MPMSNPFAQSHQHVLGGAVLGGLVALFLVYEGIPRLGFMILVLPLTLLGAWLGWMSSPEAKRHYLLKRQDSEDEAGFYKQEANKARAATDVHKAVHGLEQVGKEIKRDDEIAKDTHRKRRLEIEVAEAELLGKLEGQKTFSLDQWFQRFMLRRKIRVARRAEMEELEEDIERAIQAVEDVAMYEAEKVREISARTDVSGATKQHWIENLERVCGEEILRRQRRAARKEPRST